MSKRQAKSTFHALYTVLHDLTIKQGFVTLTGEVSLPYNWDKNADFVDLEYKLGEKQLKIKCLLMGDSFVINALLGNSVKTLELKIEHYISNFSAEDNTYDVLNNEQFERTFYDNVVFELFTELKPKKVSEDTAGQSPPSRSLLVEDPMRDSRYRQGVPRFDPYNDPFAVGGGDLDPFGGGGPGMLMDPSRAMRGPAFRGGRDPFRGGGMMPPPPGARFDPIGPEGFGPDNDELMPPGRLRRDDHDFFS